MNKSEVRKELLGIRREIKDREKKDARIYATLKDLIDKIKPESVFCYVSMNSEVDTKKFIAEYFDKTEIYAPYTSDGNMTLRRLRSVMNLSTDKLGNVEESCLGEERTSCSVSIIPLVGFNEEKKRMGYGGGYYDKYLSTHETFTVGLAYDEQFVKDLPVESHDAILNIIITQDKIYL